MITAERVLQFSKTLRQNLAQFASELGDIGQSEVIGLEPFDTGLIDVSSPDLQTNIGREINVQGGIGIAIQFLPTTPLPSPSVGDVKVYINRPDGFSLDPAIDKILPVWPIAKLYVKAKAGATGGVRIRIYKDPTLLFTISPESAQSGGGTASEVKVQNASGTVINPATEDTLAAGVKIKNATGTVINPATEDTLAGGVKVKNASGTVINPATEDTLAGGVKVKNASGTVINPATEGTLSSVQTNTNPLASQRTSIAHNQVTVGTTAVQLSNVTIPSGFSVVVKALAGNTGKVYIGLSSVTTSNGYELSAGEEAPPLQISNLNVLYAVADAAGQKICYIVEQ